MTKEKTKKMEFYNAYYDFYSGLNHIENELQKMARNMDSKGLKYISEINEKIKDIYKIYYKLYEIYLYEYKLYK